MTEDTSTIHVVVPDRVHQIARLRAVERRLTLKDYIATLILEDVARQTASKAPEPQGDNA